MFHCCAVKCGALMPDNIKDLMGSEQYRLNKLLNACTRLLYTQPLEQVILNVDKEVAQTFAEE